MNKIIELIDNLNKYLIAVNAPRSNWEYVATVFCPIISTVAIVIGGLFALYKYRATQNYDINLKILNEVYLPLYSYLVKQETFRFIACPESSWKETPILEIKSIKTKQTWTKDGISAQSDTSAVCGCTRESLLEVCETANLGLASTELATLLNAYKVLVHISVGNINSKEKAKAVIMQEKIEIALRKEILRGYRHYHKKLKLHNSFSDIYSITEEQICFLSHITNEEINETIETLNNIVS